MQMATITTFPGPLKKTDVVLDRGYKKQTDKNTQKISKISREQFDAYKWSDTPENMSSIKPSKHLDLVICFLFSRICMLKSEKTEIESICESLSKNLTVSL